MKKIYSLIQFCLLTMVIFSSATTSLNAQCMDGTTEVSITMLGEGFPGETSWVLWDATAGMVLAGVNSGAGGSCALPSSTTSGGWENNSTVTVCAPDGNSLELYTFETFGDGWNGGMLTVETTEDASGFAATTCAPQNIPLFQGTSSASGNGSADCSATMTPGGVLAASFSTVCITCDIVCPDDISVENDPGLCSASVVLPAAMFDPSDCGLEVPTDVMTTTTGDLDMEFGGLVYAGQTIVTPAGPAPGPCVTEVPFTFSWNTDNGAGFESTEITFPAPLINPATVTNLNGAFPANGTVFPAGATGTDMPQGGPLAAGTGMPTGNGDCTIASMDIVISVADYANWNGGSFMIAGDGDINQPLCAENTISIESNVPTTCSTFAVSGIPGVDDGASPASIAAGADFPLGTTTVCYTATGSANGVSFPVSCKFDVSVMDTEAPVIACPGDFTFSLQGGECCQIFEFDVSATDNCFMNDGLSTLVGPFCDPCVAPSQGSSLACTVGSNAIIQIIDGAFVGDTLTEVCFNQTNFDLPNNSLATINVYCYDGINVPFTDGAGTFVPFATEEIAISGANNGTCVCTEFVSLPVVPAGCTSVVVEVFTSDGRVVQTPAVCNGQDATGDDTFIVGPVCGITTPTSFSDVGFVLDAGFNMTFKAPELLSIDDTATPGNPGFDTFNEFESGDELPIGIHCFAYVATDRAGNQSNCDFCVTVNGVPESQIVNSLTCNNSVNLSLDENCQAFISADMFLEGGPYGCYFDCYEVYITDAFGNNVVSGCGDAATKVPGGNPLFANTDINDVNGCVIDIPCGEYTVMVYDRCNENTCWGNLVVEDKIAPIVTAPLDITINCLMDTAPGNNTVEGVAPLALVDAPSAHAGTVGGLVYTSTQTLVPTISGSVITDINIDIDFSHSWVNDLDIILTGPDGASIFITDSDCGAADNIQATFDEESGVAITCGASIGVAHEDCDEEQMEFTLGDTYETASFTNAGVGLDQWYGLPVAGDWTVEVFDNFGFADGGCLKAFDLSFAFTAVSSGMPVIENGCGSETITFQDEIFDVPNEDPLNSCDNQLIERTWLATDEKGNTGTAVSTILIEPIGLDAVNVEWFYPSETVDLTCDACITPECIYDTFREQFIADNPPASPEVAESDIYLASANAAGVRMAYPFFFNREGLQERFDINNCNMFFSFSDLVLPTCGTGCSGNSKIIRTWTALDWCTGDTGESVQVIHAKDNEGPTIELVDQSITVSASIHDCAANFILPQPKKLLDNCSSEVTYTIYGAPGTVTDISASPFFDNGVWRVIGLPKSTAPHIYTYAAEDCCGNVTTVTLEVNVIDATPPIAIGTQNIVINLTSSPNDPDGGVAKLFSESVDNGSHDGGCGPVRLAIRRTDVEDDFGICGSTGVINNSGIPWNNNSTFFNFNDVPELDQPTDHSRGDTDNGDFVKFCCNDLSSPNALTDANGMTYVIIEVELGVWDDADGDGTPGSSLGDQFSKTWVNVRVESKLQATIVCPPLVKITCEMDETDLSVTGSASANATCGGLNATYMDLCGLDINQDMEIGEFEGSGTINEVGMCYDVNGDGVIANFDGSGSNIGEDFFNKACHYGPITRYWSVEGTDIKCRQIIIIEEPTGVFAGNGLDLNDDGDCNDFGEICPVIDWPYSRNDFINLVSNDGAADCDGDGRGNEISTSDITLVDPNGTMRGYPTYSEVAMDCIDALCEEPVWVDANCSLVGWSLDSDTFFFEGDACLKIINTYTVIDWCQYDPTSLEGDGIWTWRVVGKLLDPYPPVVTADNGIFPAIPGGSGSVNPTSGACVGFATAAAVAFDTTIDDDGEVIDNACPSQWLKWNVYVDLNNDWVFDREWSSFVAEDKNNASDPLWSEDNAADNISSYGYTIPDVRVGNTGGVDNAIDFATEPGFEYIINIPDAIPADCGDTQHRVVWKVYDGCGNVSSTTSFFTVQDLKAPTPYCVNLSTALMADPDGAGPEVSNVELWAIDFDFGSFDNCTNPEDLRFTFSSTPPQDDPDYIEERRSSAKVFTCDDLFGTNDATPSLQIYVWDGCNNFDFCNVNLRIIDNSPEGCGDGTGTGSIAGNIVTEFGENVDNVEVTNVDMADSYVENNMTDDNGDYAFSYAVMSHDFEITADKTDDYLNGVSTLDLVIIQRHILGSAQLDSPYKMIAADVNNDKAITAIDLIQLRKLILGIYDELPNNSSWRFADEATTIDMTNPWNTLDETVNIYNLTSDMMDENFIGIKVGDVNQSVVANAASTSTESRSASSINVLFDDRAVAVGEMVELVIEGESINDLYGYQFTLETEGLELVEVESGIVEVSNANFGALGNKVTTSWNTLSPINADGALFTMTFKSNVSGQLSEILDLNSSVTRAEAYVGDNLEILSIDLRNGEGDVNYALYQNEPNPFSDKTIVGFDLPEAGTATLTVLDVTGKVLRVINGDYAKGYNELELSKSDFGSAGVYYYQLDSGDFTATKKMIIIE